MAENTENTATQTLETSETANEFENLVGQTPMTEPEKEFWLGLAKGHITADRIQPSAVIYRLLEYKAPPYPSDSCLSAETWDIRAEKGVRNPENILDAFIFDILANAQKFGIAKRNAWQAVKLYKCMNWRNLGGYRAWTCWNFVQGLNYDEMFKLEREVDEALSSGRDWENDSDDIHDFPEEYRDRDFYRRRRNAFAEVKKFYEILVRARGIFELMDGEGMPSVKIEEFKQELSDAINEYDKNLIPNL